MKQPTKRYQAWSNGGEGFTYEEFDTELELRNWIESGTYNSFFVNELKTLTVRVCEYTAPEKP